MGNYEDMLKEIETTIGIVSGFMKALAEDVLLQEWLLFKKYVLGKLKILAKYRAHVFPLNVRDILESRLH